MSGTDASDRDAARGATESDFPCCEVVGEGSDPQKAREARYAEAIAAVGRGLGWNDFYDEDAACAARAVLAVADAEQARLKAEVERLRGEVGTLGSVNASLRAEVERLRAELAEGKAAAADVLSAWRRMRGAALAAEAALASEREAHAGLRARLEALAKKPVNRDDVVRLVPPLSINGRADTYVSQYALRAALRAALAAEPAAHVAAEEGGAR